MLGFSIRSDSTIDIASLYESLPLEGKVSSVRETDEV